MPISKALAVRSLTMIGVEIMQVSSDTSRQKEIADVFVKSVGKYFSFTKSEQIRLKLRIFAQLTI